MISSKLLKSEIDRKIDYTIHSLYIEITRDNFDKHYFEF